MGQSVKPLTRGGVLISLAAESDITRNKDPMGYASLQRPDHLSGIRDELLFNIGVYVNLLVAFLTEMDVREINKYSRHGTLKLYTQPAQVVRNPAPLRPH
jgi:hypothetical protein